MEVALSWHNSIDPSQIKYVKAAEERPISQDTLPTKQQANHMTSEQLRCALRTRVCHVKDHVKNSSSRRPEPSCTQRHKTTMAACSMPSMARPPQARELGPGRGSSRLSTLRGNASQERLMNIFNKRRPIVGRLAVATDGLCASVMCIPFDVRERDFVERKEGKERALTVEPF